MNNNDDFIEALGEIITGLVIIGIFWGVVFLMGAAVVGAATGG
jgi:hypothetical protein